MTHRWPRLGGAIGAAILDAALAAGWVRKTGGRALSVTDAGRARLPQLPPVVSGRSG